MARFIVSVGDSDKYSVNFNGDKSQFEDSECFVALKKRMEDFLKEKFPSGGFNDVVPLQIAEDDGIKDYQVLDEKTIPQLLESAATQVEVKLRTNMQNLNAPFDKE